MREGIKRYVQDPVLDFEEYDLRHPAGSWDAPFPPFPSKIVEAANAMFALGDILRKVHGDQITIPEELRGQDHVEDVAKAIGRRFDIESNLIKRSIHAKEAGDRGWKAAAWGAGGLFALAVEITVATSGNIWASLGVGAIDATLIDRTCVNAVEAAIARDRGSDEVKRTGKGWYGILGDQIDEAIKQAGLSDNAEASALLRRRAIELVVERHVAFNNRFPNTRQGKYELQRAIKYAVNMHDTQMAFDKYMHSLERGGKRNRRGDMLRQMLVYEKNHVISYQPELKRYVSLAELKKEEEAARKAAERAARPRRSRWFGYGL